MAYSAAMVWEVRTGGSDTVNGGGFRGGAVIAAPGSAPTVTGFGTGGTVAASTYYIVITHIDAQGETTKSPEASVTTTGATSRIVITSPTRPTYGMVWGAYVGTTSGGPYFPIATNNAYGTDVNRTTTPPTSGTGPPGTDYSQQDAAQVTYTDLAIDATTNTNATSAAHPFTQAQIGNVVPVTGGTGFTVQRVELLNVSAAGVATFDKSLGTLGSTGGTGSLGGALASCGMASGLAVAGNVVFRKYNATAETMGTTANVAAGRVNSSAAIALVSYDANRTVANRDANRQELRPSANAVTAVTLSGSGALCANFTFANPSNFTTFAALTISGSLSESRRCRFVGTMTTGLTLSASATIATEPEASIVTGTAYSISGGGALVYAATADACTGDDYSLNITSSYAVLVKCASSNKTAGRPIFASTISGLIAIDCSLHLSGSNASSPVALTSALRLSLLANCAAWGTGSNTAELVDVSTAPTSRFWALRALNCAIGNGGTPGNYDPVIPADAILNPQSPTTIPFTNAALGDLSPNSVATGGALLRGNAFPATLPGLATTNTGDIGAVQAAPVAAVNIYRRRIRPLGV